jgi:hypothetical protein
MDAARTLIQTGIVVATLTLFVGCRHIGDPDVGPGGSHYPEKKPGPPCAVITSSD